MAYEDKASYGWQRPIGCLKLQVCFHKKTIGYRALLRKMTYEDKASDRCSPPCSSHVCGCVGVVYAHEVGFLWGEFFVLVCFNFLVIFWRVCPFLW